MSPPINHRLLCPALNLMPPETSQHLIESEIAFFQSVPFSAGLLATPGARPFLSPSRNPPPGGRQDQFIGKTIKNEHAVPHFMNYVVGERAELLDASKAVFQTHLLVAVGDGTSGFAGVMHGGMVAALLDESMGAFVDLNIALGKEAEAMRTPNVTAALNISYLKPVPTNSVLHITTTAEKMQGRKTNLVCEMEDQNGVLLAKCTSVWLALKSSL